MSRALAVELCIIIVVVAVVAAYLILDGEKDHQGEELTPEIGYSVEVKNSDGGGKVYVAITFDKILPERSHVSVVYDRKVIGICESTYGEGYGPLPIILYTTLGLSNEVLEQGIQIVVEGWDAYRL